MWPERAIRSAVNRRDFARLRRQLDDADAGEWIARQPIRASVVGYGRDDAKAILNIAHPIGKGLLSAFGAGSIADAAENLEVHYGVLDAPKQPPAQKSAAQSLPFAQPQSKMPDAASTVTKPAQLQWTPAAIDFFRAHPYATAGGLAAVLYLLVKVIR